MKNEVLFLSHRMPFPPDRGDKIRSHHILKRLAGLAPVHVATFADDERDMAEEVELAAIAESYRLVRRNKPLAFAGAEALLKRLPVSLMAFHDAGLADYVKEVVRRRPVGTIYLFSGQMGQYIPDDFDGRIIFDFVDVDSAKFEAYAQRHTGVRRWIDQREARMLHDEEVRLAARADVSLLVSDEEARLFRDRLPPDVAGVCDVRSLRNGVDTAFYDPDAVRPEPRMLAVDGPRLIFTGQMDYAPNIEAVLRAIKRIMPQLRQVVPQASLHVVGRNPAEEILAHHERNGVFVWGGVDDIRPWLAAADLALVPLEIARGIQNKVLEAMAMGKPVVLSRAAATGIGATDTRHFAVAEADAEFANRAAALISHPRQAWAMGNAARLYLVENMSWPAMLAPLAGMLRGDIAAANRAA